MQDDRRGNNLTTPTVVVANPSRHFRRRLKTKGDIDSISSLPNEILHQILSFIPTKLAIRTSVLSKRWKHVWCETPCLDLHHLKSSRKSSIIKTLDSYSAAKITSFRLRTRVNTNKKAQHVKSLIKFAMTHNVENLSLEVSKHHYRYCSFQDSFFSNSSLKQLFVDARYYSMVPECTVSWTSLRSLSLSRCKLSDASFSKILSGSPMLESLTLKYINSLEYLDLRKSLRLRRLDIYLSSMAGRTMQIVAPHIYSLRLRNLRLIDYPYKIICTLVDVSSITEADINFRKVLPSKWCNNTATLKDANISVMVKTMLEKLENIEDLTLGVSFLQMLSIAEFRGVPFPTFKVKTLTLETRILRSVVPGLARLLQNSPEVKKITLNAINCFFEVDQCVYRYLDKQELHMDQSRRLKNWATTTLETLVLRLGSYFDRSRFGELTQITHTLSHDKVSIVIK